MKNSEKGKFEDAWQKVFENAEQAPSEDVWAGVELGLNKAETLVMKRRVVFYQRLAAASLLFALLLGGLGTYYITDLVHQQENNLVLKELSPSQINDKGENTNPPIAINESNNALNKNIATGDNSIANVSEVNRYNRSTSLVANYDNQVLNRYQEEHVTADSQLNVTKINDPNYYPTLISLIPEPTITLNGKLKEVTIVRKLPAMPADFMTSKKDGQTSESLWASLGASTGNYSPSADFGMGSSSKAYAQSPTGISNAQGAYSTTASRGTAFSVGMNIGKRISKRWLLQGGISYLNQAIGYTSNYAVVDANNNVLASVADYSSINSFSSMIAVSSPYEINSVNEYLSVPVQVGYLLVDQKIGFQLNSGLSTDFFMQNTLTDKSGQMASFSSSAGNDSPYRTVSWSGLVGTELSYKIATQYRISVAPGLRYSLNSVLKSDAVSTNPLVWDVGFRFRYIFK
jgi:hypothetical protein